MKQFIITLIFFIFITMLPTKADLSATQTFVVDADNTITIVTTGNLTSSIDGFTGQMSTPLWINFNITTNEDVNDIRLKAMVVDSVSTKHSAFGCTETGTVTTENAYLIFGEENTSGITFESIQNCKDGTSTAELNPCTIAYPATITIDQNGTLQFMSNGSEGYFSANILTGTTNINMTLGTAIKPGTFDSDSAYDCADNYQVEIYLDNIPG